ncbi:flavin reductase family protein [Actinophytocola sp.]|uniref:flavin reductase family protein n=1 Tax=Actinophytocola sp. TaxID=1872138 RepID=UPI003D6C44A1
MTETATSEVEWTTTRSGVGDTDFRELMNVFPSGVTVVTTQDPDGTPHGLTCTSMCSVSLRPPILLACLHNHSQTLASVLRQGTFAVNLLHAGGRRAAEVFASAVRDRFAAVHWDRTPRRGLPWLTSDAHAVAECDVVEATVAGDHVVVFGQVDGVLTRPQNPLMYGLRSYAAWTGA